MVVGWSLLAFTLGHYTSMGYLEGFIGCESDLPAHPRLLLHDDLRSVVFQAIGAYMFVFGLMGLIPAPKVKRR
jgi:hypothetical protein